MKILENYTKLLTGGCVCEGIMGDLLYFSILFKFFGEHLLFQYFENIFIYFFNVYLFLRQRQSMNGGGAERERETQNRKQAPGSEPSAQSPTGARTHGR